MTDANQDPRTDGRFHYLRGVRLVQERNGADYQLLEQMVRKLGLEMKDLEDPEVASQYAMARIRITDGQSMLAEASWKQMDPRVARFNLTPAARTEAEESFRDWAAEKGYEPIISHLWARPPGP